MTILKTKRLILRPWKESDLKLFAELNADPRVMEFFPSILNQNQSDELGRSIMGKIEEQKWGLWAVEVPKIADFIGFIGLAKPSFEAHFTPAIEIGWRLGFQYWEKGYASEGAKAALAYGFNILKLPEIVSFTASQNLRSRHVMEKIGMHYNPQDDFDHPKLPYGHWLKKHVLYRLSFTQWQNAYHVE